MTEEMEDMLNFLKALKVSKEDAKGIALLMNYNNNIIDELNQYLVEKIESHQVASGGEILTKAMKLIKKK